MAKEEKEKRRSARRRAEPEAQSFESFESWSKLALRRIWLPKERERVRAELEDHYLDRLEDYQAQGLSKDDAKKKAVACLGDPDETAELLGRVHQPWLTVLVSAARVLIVLLAMALLICFAERYLSLRPLRSLDTREIADAGRWGSENTERTVIARRKGISADSVSFGPFEVSVEAAGFHRDRLVTRDARYGSSEVSMETECAVVLRYKAAPWLRMHPDVVDRVVRVEDSTGRSYHSVVNLKDRQWGEGSFFQYTGRVRPNSFASVFYFDNMGETPDWMDFYLEQGEAGKRLRVFFGPWEYQRDELEPMELPEVLNTAEKTEPDLLCLGVKRVYSLQSAVAGAQTGEGQALQIPWSRRSVWNLNRTKLDELRRREGQEEEELPERLELVECAVVFPDYPDSFPFHPDDMAQRLQIVDKATGAPVEWAFTRTPMWYSDACVHRLEWLALPGSASYEIRYTDPVSGESRRAVFTLGEEGSAP